MRRPPPKKKGQGRGNRTIAGALLGVHEAAEWLGITEKTLRARVSRRIIPFKRWGARICFSRAEMERFYAELDGCTPDEARTNLEARHA